MPSQRAQKQQKQQPQQPQQPRPQGSQSGKRSQDEMESEMDVAPLEIPPSMRKLLNRTCGHGCRSNETGR